MSEEHNFLYTQYIIMNSDVKMGKGKMIGQGCHASLGAYILCEDIKMRNEWLEEGARKIILKADTQTIKDLFWKITKEYSQVPMYITFDFGLTQITPGSLTALGIGPYDIEILQEYVKDLKLV